jgi:pimeloyl-ACP methyl ester carboxylesterase
LRESGVPIAVVWGSQDEYLPLETVGRSLASALGVDLITVEGGHFLPVDNPERAARAILDRRR